MNLKNFLLAVLTSAIFTLSGAGNLSNAKVSQAKTSMVTVSYLNKSSGAYTYERVFKDGVWWIYVYDGFVLIDMFPED